MHVTFGRATKKIVNVNLKIAFKVNYAHVSYA